MHRTLIPFALACLLVSAVLIGLDLARSGNMPKIIVKATTDADLSNVFTAIDNLNRPDVLVFPEPALSPLQIGFRILCFAGLLLVTIGITLFFHRLFRRLLGFAKTP